MSKKIIAFMDAYTQGKSGGDVALIEIIKRLPGYNKSVVTSLLGKNLCENRGLDAEYFITTRERQFGRVILTYIIRIIKGCCLSFKPCSIDIIYSSSDFLPDVLPALLCRVRRRSSRWVQKIHHLIPEQRIIPYLAQRLSLFFIRHFAKVC